MPSITTPVEESTLVWALGSLCQINRVPFDPALLSQHFPPPYSLETLLHALQAYGFKAEAKSISKDNIAQLVFPCVAVVRLPDLPAAEIVEVVIPESDPTQSLPEALPEQAPQAPVQRPHSLALIVKADAERLMFF